jgi:hypothetical protein
LTEICALYLVGTDVEVPEVLKNVAGFGRLVDLFDEVERDIEPSDRYVCLLFEFLEVEGRQIFEEVITSIDTLHF